MKKFYSFLIIINLILLCSIASADRVTNNLILLYDFTATGAAIVADRSTDSPKLDLQISDPSKVTWLEPGLKVTSATLVKTNTERTKLGSDVFFNGGITIEAWVKPLNNTQSGPARLITFSSDSGNRNFTFGQSGNYWNVRFRTSLNPGNGTSPSTSTPANSIATTPALQHVIYTRDAAGNAKMYIDKVQVSTESVPGDGSNWDATYGFGLFNEISFPTDTRTWLGDIFLIAIYSKNLSSSEITQNFDAGYEIPPIVPPISKTYKIVTTFCDLTTKTTTTRVDYGMTWTTFMKNNPSTDSFVNAKSQDGAEVSGLILPADPSEIIEANLVSTITTSEGTRTIKIYKAICTKVNITPQ